jgi:sugar-phosphatase
MGAKKLGIPIDQCVVVEDAPIGVMAGNGAGMRVIGIASTHPDKELLDVGVDFLVENLLKIQISENAQSQSIIIKLKTR